MWSLGSTQVIILDDPAGNISFYSTYNIHILNVKQNILHLISATRNACTDGIDAVLIRKNKDNIVVSRTDFKLQAGKIAVISSNRSVSSINLTINT